MNNGEIATFLNTTKEMCRNPAKSGHQRVEKSFTYLLPAFIYILISIYIKGFIKVYEKRNTTAYA